MEEMASREYLSDDFGKHSIRAGILMGSFWSRRHVEDVVHSSNWIHLFGGLSTGYHILSNVVEKTLLGMLYCSRRALWTLSCDLVSEVLPSLCIYAVCGGMAPSGTGCGRKQRRKGRLRRRPLNASIPERHTEKRIGNISRREGVIVARN
jgi:hypothetical protein